MNAPTDMNALSTRIITVNLPARPDIEGKALSLLESAQSLLIDSPMMHEIAAEELRTIKTAASKLEETRKSHVSPLNEEVKYINDWFREARAMLEQAEADLKQKMLGWQEEQERLRLEQQRKLEEAARAERARIAAENEARRRAAEEQAARQLAEMEALLAKEREAQLEAQRQKKALEAAQRAGDQARAAEARRQQEEAEKAALAKRLEAEATERSRITMLADADAQAAAAQLAATVITAPVVAPTAKVVGIATKGTYKGKCTDLLALVQFIAKNPQYLNLVQPNATAINQLAKAQREATRVDGLLVWEEKTLAARRA